jgi:hypothetical protein
LKSSINEVIAEYGPQLSKIIIFQTGGVCPRSELDTFSEPLKKMVFRQKHAKQWLEAALQDPDFPKSNIDEAKKRVFLLKVMNARGGKQTNTIVRDFWMDCRGQLFNYAS